MKLTDFFLAPASWSQESYRDVYFQEDIYSLPYDWEADSDDCDYIGKFATREDAIATARLNPNWACDMRDEINICKYAVDGAGVWEIINGSCGHSAVGDDYPSERCWGDVRFETTKQRSLK